MSHDLRPDDSSTSPETEFDYSDMITVPAQEWLSLAYQGEFLKWGPHGLAGFWAYEMRRNELMQLLRKPRGRQPSDEVTTALRLEKEGLARKEIYMRLGKNSQ